MLVLLFVAACSGTTVSALEKKIKRSELPPAVEKTVQTESAGATIKGFSKETKNGRVYYEAELVVNGHTKDVLMDADGAVVEVEEEMSFEELPANVKAGLSEKAGKGRITKVESMKKHDKLVAYEAQVSTNGKSTEIQVGPHGETLAHEE
jgi:hypothetical protein